MNSKLRETRTARLVLPLISACIRIWYSVSLSGKLS